MAREIRIDMPSQSLRDAQDEIEALRQELAEAKRLTSELDKALDREHVIEKQHLSDLVDAQRGLEHCRRLLAEHADCTEPECVAEIALALAGETSSDDRLREAATRVVQLVDHGADSLAVGGAIAELRRVLDGAG